MPGKFNRIQYQTAICIKDGRLGSGGKQTHHNRLGSLADRFVQPRQKLFCKAGKTYQAGWLNLSAQRKQSQIQREAAPRNLVMFEKCALRSGLSTYLG